MPLQDFQTANIRAMRLAAMAKPYQLKPTFDRKHNKWRLNLPAVISSSGKRERHLFEKHHEALAEANRLRKTFHDYGKSMKMLPANRLIEAIESWDLPRRGDQGASVKKPAQAIH
jgi:hypothetical protein